MDKDAVAKLVEEYLEETLKLHYCLVDPATIPDEEFMQYLQSALPHKIEYAKSLMEKKDKGLAKRLLTENVSSY